MKKSNILFILLVLIVLTLSVLVFLHQSSFLYKRVFNKAFKHRMAGQCELLTDYIHKYQQGWKTECATERDFNSRLDSWYKALYAGFKRGEEAAFYEIFALAPIKNYKILKTSQQLGADEAFVEINLTKQIGDEERSMVQTYRMQRLGWFTWKLIGEVY